MIDFVARLVEDHVDSDGSSIFGINSRMLAFCTCFTTECGSPGIFKSMSSSMISRLNSLSVFDHLGLMMYCIAAFIKLPWSIWKKEFFVRKQSHSLENGDVFLITSCVIIGCPDLSQIGLGIGWVGRILLVEQLLLVAVEQLLSPIL